MLRRMPEPCEPVMLTVCKPSAPRTTMPRWYSVRPGFLRIACALATRISGSGCGVAPLIASRASRTKA